MDISGYFKERAKAKILMRIFTLGVIICLLPIGFIYYGLYNPNGIEWVFVALVSSIGASISGSSLYKWWNVKQKAYENISD